MVVGDRELHQLAILMSGDSVVFDWASVAASTKSVSFCACCFLRVAGLSVERRNSIAMMAKVTQMRMRQISFFSVSCSMMIEFEVWFRARRVGCDVEGVEAGPVCFEQCAFALVVVAVDVDGVLAVFRIGDLDLGLGPVGGDRDRRGFVGADGTCNFNLNWAAQVGDGAQEHGDEFGFERQVGPGR